MAEYIRLEDFSFTYPSRKGDNPESAGDRVRTLDSLTLSIERGEFLLVQGASGSGKSSLLLALSGMIPHVTGGKIAGRLLLDGRDIRELNPSLISDMAGAAFQNPHTQLFTSTVAEEIAFPLQNRAVPCRDMNRRIKESLAFTGLTGLEERSPRTLSGGEKQRLLLAVLFAWDPPVFLLDEPLSALDPRGREEMISLLGALNKEKGKTIIIAEKRDGALRKRADRILRLDKGRITREVTGEFPFPPGKKLILEKPGSEARRPRRGRLAMENISFAYPGEKSLLNDFSLELVPGEITALTGANGSGKSTLAALMMGLEKPDKGRILLDGNEITSHTPARRSRRIGYLFQNPDNQLFSPTVAEEIAFGLSGERERIKEKVHVLLERFGLSPMAETPPALLSFALRKRVALACAAAGEPDLLILDEPDWGQDRDGLILIAQYAGECISRGGTVLLISHSEELVDHLASRRIVLEGGRV